MIKTEVVAKDEPEDDDMSDAPLPAHQDSGRRRTGCQVI